MHPVCQGSTECFQAQAIVAEQRHARAQAVSNAIYQAGQLRGYGPGFPARMPSTITVLPN